MANAGGVKYERSSMISTWRELLGEGRVGTTILLDLSCKLGFPCIGGKHNCVL